MIVHQPYSTALITSCLSIRLRLFDTGIIAVKKSEFVIRYLNVALSTLLSFTDNFLFLNIIPIIHNITIN